MLPLKLVKESLIIAGIIAMDVPEGPGNIGYFPFGLLSGLS